MNNPYSNVTYVYAYDKGGNITSVKTYAYTTATTLGTPTSTITYTYGETAWKDKLTSYNGTNITYDSIGNPLNYRNGTLGWAGRQLKSYTSTSGVTTIYTYNSDGVRIGKKSVYQGNTSETSYVVSGTQILSETKGSNTIYYIYDEKGLPIGIVYNGVTYTYRKNVQGDIIAILNSAGTEVVNYTYNAWGMLIGMSGSLASTLGAKNPFRYRGYYYDTETGYYYLNSRYYDPVTGRFLNADGFVSTGQGVLSCNMFAYCGNNPVMRVDPEGEFWLSALVGAVVNVTTTFIAAKITGQEYTFTDGLVAFAAGAANAIPVVGTMLSGAITGIYTGYNSYKNGAPIESAILCGAVAGVCTTASISNLANLGGNTLDIAATVAADLTFGTAYNSVAAATYKAVTPSDYQKYPTRISSDYLSYDTCF